MATTTPSYTIDPSKQTVSGQMTGLLEADNPYINQARKQGESYASKRGLLNSSMAAEASEDAAIKAALPIAQADAAVHNNFADKQYGAELQKDLNTQTQGFEQANMQLADSIQQTQMKLENALRQGDMQLANELQKDINTQQNLYQHGMLDREQAFAADQNQAKFDQDWRMTLAESATQREIAALEQQSLQFAQFTKGVADINSADMTGSEKSAAVSSLWTQFQKGSAIADSLRNIEINSDGSVDRSGSTSTSTASYQTSEPSPTKVSYTFGDGGFYVPGVTTDGSGNVVDKNGQAAPEDKAPSYYTEGYTWELSGGAWVKKTIPKNTNIFDSYSSGQ